MSCAALLVFARCTGFVFRAPGFAHPAVPRALRAGLALALALCIAPSVRSPALDGLALLAALAFEFSLGTAIGMSASAIYDGAYAGGRMLDDYVGVKAIAPNVQLVAPSGFGRTWALAFTASFVLLGAYRPVVLGFASSFERVPPGASIDSHAWFAFATSVGSTIVLTGLTVAAPAIALAFVVQVALAALARTVPRFATLTLSFPMVFAAVSIVTAISLPVVAALAGHPTAALPVAR